MLPSPTQVTVPAGDVTAVFDECLHVCQQLAGVAEIGEAVDHRYLRVSGKGLDVGVVEGADHDAVDHARKHPCGVSIGSPPSWVSRGDRKIAAPPSCVMPASKDTRAGGALSKIMPNTCW